MLIYEPARLRPEYERGWSGTGTRIAPGLLCLLIFCLFAWLYNRDPAAYHTSLMVYGIDAFQFPFLDMEIIPAAGRCRDAGVDIYGALTCDVLGRPYLYSPLLIDLLPAGLVESDTLPIGIFMALAFFASLGLLPSPGSGKELAVRCGASVSPMVVYGVERANLDILLFAGLIAAMTLAGRGAMARLGAYAIIACAALLKFYPVAALVYVLSERRRRAAAISLAMAVMATIFIITYRVTLLRALSSYPSSIYFTDLFGAVNLPYGFAQEIVPLGRFYPMLAGPLHWLAPVLFMILVLQTAAAALHLVPIIRHGLANLPPVHKAGLVMGSAILVACFFKTQNVDYRGVFFLMVYPGLYLLSEAARYASLRAMPFWILFLMWGECFREAIMHGLPPLGVSAAHINEADFIFWLIRELVWWRVIGVLAGIILAFLAEADSHLLNIGAQLRQRFGTAKRLTN